MDGEIQEMELPPLARRILHFRSAAFENVGITPTRAGNTGVHRWWRTRFRNYPRLREEYARTLPSSTVISELPLLARVIQVTAKIISENQRITPACAGNTRPCCRGCPRTRNYPGSRGEYETMSFSPFQRVELPPLARGILRDSDYGCIVPGITPAHAGNTNALPLP